MYNNPCWASWSHLTLITHIKGQQCDFSLQDSSDRSLALLGKTDLYTSLRLWEGSYWTRERRCQNEKKISSSCNTTGGLFNGVPQSTSSKGAKPASGLFFWKKGRKLCWLWSLNCFSSSHEWGVQWFLLGVQLTVWVWQCTFDFDVNLCNLPAKKVVTRWGGMCSMRCNSSVVPNCESQESLLEPRERLKNINPGAPKFKHARCEVFTPALPFHSLLWPFTHVVREQLSESSQWFKKH